LNKKRISSHNKYFTNPSITHFNEGSNFIYDLDEVDRYLMKIKNKNLLKLNQNEIKCIESIIFALDKEKQIKNNNNFILINKKLAEEIDSYNKETIVVGDDLEIFLMNEFKENENRTTITVRKLAKKYEEKTGRKTSKSTVHNYLTKRLGYKYIKSTIKTDLILNNNSILISFSFIKIIARCIKLGFSIIYCDESYLQTQSNTMKVWKKSDEDIYENLGKKEKTNLILAVNEDGVIHYEINKENTKEDNFLSYMENLLKKIKEKNIKHFVIILDNYSSHKTDKLTKFYYENKINILFNTPYLSKFNSVELAFRNIKRNLYLKNFKSIEDIIKEVKMIIEDERFKNGIKGNYCITLKEYLKFNEKERFNNINLLID